jgi:hypothetical protein
VRSLESFQVFSYLALANFQNVSFAITVDSHLKMCGINIDSATDVIKVFKEYNNFVTVAPLEERIYPMGKKAGKLGELVSYYKACMCCSGESEEFCFANTTYRLFL